MNLHYGQIPVSIKAVQEGAPRAYNPICFLMHPVLKNRDNGAYGFIRTKIPVKEACINGEPVARSQARRICNRLEEFKEVLLDLQDVEFMGQGFADEIFRVYAVAHPEVILHPVNMIPVVERMIRHVSRGTIPGNVCLEQ